MDSHQKNQDRRRTSNNDKSQLRRDESPRYSSQGGSNKLYVDSTSTAGQIDRVEDSLSTNAGDFDLYLFAQVWAPRFCCTKQKQCREDQNKNDLTIHGLWPAYQAPRQAGSTYPTYCITTNDTYIQSKDKLAVHEWRKHGTCLLLKLLNAKSLTEILVRPFIYSLSQSLV